MEEGDDLSSVVDDARKGDEDAWELLYRNVYPRLWAYLARRVGSDGAEDAVSETMSRAVAGFDRFTLGPAGFDGWVFGIARRVAADHHRRAGRLRRHHLMAAGAGSVPDDQPDEALLESDQRRQVLRAFAQLSPDEQEVLELRLVAGLSAEQVAAVVGKRPGAVRTAQSRALARLRQLLEYGDG